MQKLQEAARRYSNPQFDLTLLLRRCKRILQRPNLRSMDESVKRIRNLLTSLEHFQDIKDNYKQNIEEFIRGITELSTLVQLKVIKKNEFVFHMGQISDYVYFVLEGRVVVLIPKSGVEIMEERKIKLEIQNLKSEIQYEKKYPKLENNFEKHFKRLNHLKHIL